MRYFRIVRIEDLQTYLNKHCRFRFRGGKLVYGVIWQTDDGLVFASKDGHDAIMTGSQVLAKTEMLAIDPDMVMAAELID